MKMVMVGDHGRPKRRGPPCASVGRGMRFAAVYTHVHYQRKLDGMFSHCVRQRRMSVKECQSGIVDFLRDTLRVFWLLNSSTQKFLPVSVVSIAIPSLLLDDNVEVLACREVYDSYKFATLNSLKCSLPGKGITKAKSNPSLIETPRILRDILLLYSACFTFFTPFKFRS
nr:hypothetical protein Iba_chr02aCG19860 [Ipomoea batatas]